MLFGINGFIDLALAQEIDDEARRHLQNASDTLVRSVRADASSCSPSAAGRRSSCSRSPSADAVGEAAALLEQVTGHECLIDLRLADELPPIMADSTQLEQALTNLVVNARDAGGGTIVVGTRLRVLDRPLAIDGGPLRTGPGSSSPCRTTDTAWTPRHRSGCSSRSSRPRTHGTGLGLATVFAMVRRAGGGIVVESSPDAGTTMRLLFPPAGRAI